MPGNTLPRSARYVPPTYLTNARGSPLLLSSLSRSPDFFRWGGKPVTTGGRRHQGLDRDGQRQDRYLGCPAKPAVRPRYLAAPLTAPTSSTPKSRATASEGSFDMVCCWHCHRSLTSSFAPWQICLQSPVIIRDLSSSPRSRTRCLMIPSCTHRKPALVRGHWSWCIEYLYCLFSPKQPAQLSRSSQGVRLTYHGQSLPRILSLVHL